MGRSGMKSCWILLKEIIAEKNGLDSWSWQWFNKKIIEAERLREKKPYLYNHEQFKLIILR